jgi:predicted HTH domain antitoxin
MSSRTIELPSSVSEEEATYLLAVKLYEAKRICLGKAAELAGYSTDGFVERLDEGVPVIDYDSDELPHELDV